MATHACREGRARLIFHPKYHKTSCFRLGPFTSIVSYKFALVASYLGFKDLENAIAEF
jgi:hypothetical protein